MSPDEIVSAYLSSTLSDVHAALAYQYDHRAEFDADIKAAQMRHLASMANFGKVR
jgi:uncharacterized protein (DUF433 family)